LEEFPYNEFRPGQAEVAKVVEKAVKDGAILSLRAPTGFGKTAAVIYGLLRAEADRVLWAVRTVNEIDPVVRELKAFKVKFSFLFSARRSCPLLRGTEMTSEEFWAACKLARLKGECSYHSRLNEVDFNEVDAYVRGHYSMHSIEIAGDIARHLKLCPFFALKALSLDSRFLVVTYPYVFREDIRDLALDPMRIEDFVLVVDEAHSLLNAHTMAESSLLVDDLDKVIEELVAAGYTGDATEAVKAFNSRLRKYGHPSEAILLDKDELLSGLSELVDEFESIAEDILSRKLMEALTGGGRIRVYTLRFARWLKKAVEEDAKLFLDLDEKVRVVVKAMPVDPVIVARDPLERAKAAILMSGTLPPGDFVGELLSVSRAVEDWDPDPVVAA